MHQQPASYQGKHFLATCTREFKTNTYFASYPLLAKSFWCANLNQERWKVSSSKIMTWRWSWNLEIFLTQHLLLSQSGNPQETQKAHNKETPYDECVCYGVCVCVCLCVCVSESMCTRDTWGGLVFQLQMWTDGQLVWYLNRNFRYWDGLWTSKWERQLKKKTWAARCSRRFHMSFRNISLRAIFKLFPLPTAPTFCFSILALYSLISPFNFHIVLVVLHFCLLHLKTLLW